MLGQGLEANRRRDRVSTRSSSSSFPVSARELELAVVLGRPPPNHSRITLVIPTEAPSRLLGRGVSTFRSFDLPSIIRLDCGISPGLAARVRDGSLPLSLDLPTPWAPRQRLCASSGAEVRLRRLSSGSMWTSLLPHRAFNNVIEGVESAEIATSPAIMGRHNNLNIVDDHDHHIPVAAAPFRRFSLRTADFSPMAR
jgi:hypothetical protein